MEINHPKTKPLDADQQQLLKDSRQHVDWMIS